MQNTLNFSKMHGLGNDFVVLNGIDQTISLSEKDIRALAHRHTGIGFDQLLIIKNSKKADFLCVIYNSDGTQAEQCGNGMRCVARFLYKNKLTTKKILTIETLSGIVEAALHDDDTIQINMGMPLWNTDKKIQLAVPDVVDLFILSMGNPHAIVPVSSLETLSINEWGPRISTHPFFPQGTNVGFMHIVDRQHIRLRTFERGAGETLACGSNACASVVAGIEMGLLDSSVRVELPLGSLHIEWSQGKPVLMRGPASWVFDGILELPVLL